MPKGSFRQILIYPDIKNKESDEFLENLLKQLDLQHLKSKYGWEAEKNWFEILSGGEKQRVQIVRLLYHNPVFAVMDEATSEIN